MGNPVLYVLGTKASETYQFEVDPANPVAARAALVAVAQVASVQAADLAALKAAYPGWLLQGSSAVWIGGCKEGAYYLITADVGWGTTPRYGRYSVRLALVTDAACLSLGFINGAADANPGPVGSTAMIAFDGTTAYVQVPVNQSFDGVTHASAMLLMSIEGTTTIENRALLAPPATAIVVSLGSENVLATEVKTEQLN